CHGFAVSIARADVELLEGELRITGAAQLEATGAEQAGQADDQQIPFHHSHFPLADHGATLCGAELNQLATMLTSLPGTTITLRMLRPSVKRSTFSLARAAASTSSRLALAGTSICPRSLPLTCTTRVRLSCTRADSSTCGHCASITASV